MNPVPQNQSRRRFLLLAAAAGAAAAAGIPFYHYRLKAGASAKLGPRATPKLNSWEDLYRQRWTWDKIAKGSHGWSNCRSACAWDLYVKDGVVVREEQTATYDQSEPGVPDFNPRGCQKGACYTEVMYGPSRTSVPLKRVGPRGSGKWERISWDQAMAEIAEKCVDAAVKWGPETIYQDLGPNYDNGPTTAGRFKFQLMAGGLFADMWAEIGDLNLGALMSMGMAHVGGSSDEWFLSDFLVVWMMNPSVTQIPDAHFLYEARYNGTELVVIDPIYSATAIHADQWLPLTPGSDAALGLAVARHLFEQDAIDHAYVREQTDLPILVRMDTGRMLREADLKEGGKDNLVYLWHPQKQAPVPAPGCEGAGGISIRLDFEPPIEGSWKIKLKDGQEVLLATVGSLLKESLDPWTFERTAEVTTLSVEQIRAFADGWVKAKRPMVLSSWGSNRYLHSDLMNRTKILCLMLKGAIGRKGAGLQSTGFIDLEGFGNAMQVEKDGIRGRIGMILNLMTPKDLFDVAVDMTMKRKTENQVMREGERRFESEVICNTTVTAVDYRYQGIKEALAKEQDHLLPRPLAAYHEESTRNGWEPDFPRSGSPKIFFSGGSNLLRRNNLPQYLKANMWADMELIVDINPKFSFTGTEADYILPAAGWYEKVGIKYTMAYAPYLHYCDQAIPPLAESKDEFEIYWLLSREIERIAKARDLPVFNSCHRPTDWKTLHQRYSCEGALGPKDAERVLSDIIEQSSATKGMSLEQLKTVGAARFVATGGNVSPAYTYNPDWKGKGVLNTLIAFTEYKEPWPTFSGRLTSFIDHPWFLELGEQLPTHKPSPKAGGNYPFQFVSCHARWSIHSTWRDTPMMLRFQRGEPQVWINPADAHRIGVKDYDYAEIHNDYGSVRMRIKFSTMVRPGVAYYYHAWEPHQFPNHQSFKWLIPGLINPLHMAGGTSQLQHGISKYQAGTAVQDTRVGIRPWTGQPTGAKPVVKA
ncbi:hypothetical protein B9N43_00915 [Denitratisoma sp. DHT3]|uniref:molybdopterin-dependent oxidoreductase n=1 Tax=Denitratisoma sp. DHT3 TaxID=1981880 RepID=UPI001198703F|nr:molybdopterin-dependent oxidoreductase [Denitratisoma sp. DHT3]QDX79936.1 hypothetical protein B9N43_00915 [Denitratisoma sp. DHT3]